MTNNTWRVDRSPLLSGGLCTSASSTSLVVGASGCHSGGGYADRSGSELESASKTALSKHYVRVYYLAKLCAVLSERACFK